MLRNLLLNLFLMGVFLALTDEVTFFNALIGFAIGFGVTELYVRSAGKPSYAGAVGRLVLFVLYFLRIFGQGQSGGGVGDRHARAPHDTADYPL